jgi:hypothetical protein
MYIMYMCMCMCMCMYIHEVKARTTGAYEMKPCTVYHTTPQS